MSRSLFGLVAAMALAAAPALAQTPGKTPPGETPPSDPIQQSFGQAMQAMQAGRVDDAATLLAVLAARTDAPRIRLELARALYFLGRLREARTEFLKVYDRPDLPYAVRRTVNVFLSDIDQRAGYFEPSLSLAVDSNPNQTPPTGVYDIFGIPLTYDSPAKPLTGVRVEGSGALPLGRSGFSLIGSAAVTRYGDPDVGQLIAGTGLRHTDAGRRGYWGFGTSYAERKGFDPASTVYAERVTRLTLPDQNRQLIVRAAISHTSVRNQDQLDGMGLDGGVDYGFDLSANTAVNLSAGASFAGARAAVDRRRSANLGAALTAAVPHWNKTATLRVNAAETTYGDVDPLFGKQRDDVTLGAEARLLDGHPIHGLFPSVSLSWERRNSSIRFFNYDQTGFSFGLQRRF